MSLFSVPDLAVPSRECLVKPRNRVQPNIYRESNDRLGTSARLITTHLWKMCCKVELSQDWTMKIGQLQLRSGTCIISFDLALVKK